jgi:hypothetical protein
VTWTYSGNPANSQLDEVRFLVGDTDEADPLASDEEINYALATWLPIYGTKHYVASVVAEQIAGKFARETSYSADGVSVNLSELQQKFMQRAVQLRAQHHSLLVGGSPDVGGISPYEHLEPDIKPLDFGTGMHDNYEAGRQAYGQRDYVSYDPYNDPGV